MAIFGIMKQVLEDWIYLYYLNIQFIEVLRRLCSWGLNLFVLFELFGGLRIMAHRSWGLNLFVLFEHNHSYIRLSRVLEDWIYLYYLNGKPLAWSKDNVLEDWIYLYYLNIPCFCFSNNVFLRIEFICIIWTWTDERRKRKAFLRIEFICIIWTEIT